MLHYLPTEPVPRHGARKFHGAVAQGYDAKREQSPKWLIEQKHIEGFLSDLPDGATVLDVPCGTGRFFDYYNRRNFDVLAMDLSKDMLDIAATKIRDPKKYQFAQGTICQIPLADKTADASVMCRVTRWLTPDECVQALKEMQRVTKDRIILTARVRNHPHARSYELINSALDDWAIARDEAGVDLDYRVIELRPCS